MNGMGHNCVILTLLNKHVKRVERIKPLNSNTTLLLNGLYAFNDHDANMIILNQNPLKFISFSNNVPGYVKFVATI